MRDLQQREFAVEIEISSYTAVLNSLCITARNNISMYSACVFGFTKHARGKHFLMKFVSLMENFCANAI